MKLLKKGRKALRNIVSISTLLFLAQPVIAQNNGIFLSPESYPEPIKKALKKKDALWLNYAPLFEPGTGNIVSEGRVDSETYKQGAINEPKSSRTYAAALGVNGEIVLAYLDKHSKSVKCFLNIKGPDFYIHEPLQGTNYPEEIDVYIGTSPILHNPINNKENKWIYLGAYNAENASEQSNFIPVDIPPKIEKFYYIRINDGGIPHGGVGGFDLSAVVGMNKCSDMLFVKGLESMVSFN